MNRHAKRQSEFLRLVAAAPDLLEACRALLAHVEQDEATHGREFAAGIAGRAAIAKAEGGAEDRNDHARYNQHKERDLA
jgi:hypothetical protein